MALVALVGMSLFALTSFAVGARLLRLSLRTGRLPERWIGASLFLAGGLGTTCLVVADVWRAERFVLVTAAVLAVHLGIAALGIFTWRVFRPGLMGATLVSVCVSLLALSLAFDTVGGQYLGMGRSELSLAADYTARIVLYVWATGESLRQWRLARRRVRIGLTSPLVANRFLLWAVGTGTALGVWLHSLAQEITRAGDTPEAQLVWTVLGTSCATALWLAFFPPRAYARRFAIA